MVASARARPLHDEPALTPEDIDALMAGPVAPPYQVLRRYERADLQSQGRFWSIHPLAGAHTE